MKTLKQILASHFTVFEYDGMERAVKEWLEMYRDHWLSQEDICLDDSGDWVLTELIGLLTKEAKEAKQQ